jgi:putative Mn2+ efflux pump MntP
MSFWELFVIAIGLSMDAFAVSICNGLTIKNINIKHALIIGLFFGGFQAIMPLIGYYIGTQFKVYITPVDHWIAFLLLGFIGLKMVKESRSCEVVENIFNLKSLLILSVATSIDALAVGITFAFFQANIIFAVSTIGTITFILSFLGVRIGRMLGDKFKTHAEFAGGIILILMGLKILFEHLGIFNYIKNLFL